jgi:DNA-binding GntR family transcriptional regulator
MRGPATGKTLKATPGRRKTADEQEPSRSESAYQGLLNILISGELRPNDVIMERRIAERLQVSRTPLREAIRRLEGEKLIIRQSAGTLVVAPMSTEDFLNILNVRRLLEGEAARRAASRISRDELLNLREQMVAVRNGTQPLGTDPNHLGRQLHQLIAGAASNPVLLSMIEDLGKRTRLFMRVPERRSQVTDEHLAVIDALLLGDGEGARSAMERHIDHLRGYILDKLSIL